MNHNSQPLKYCSINSFKLFLTPMTSLSFVLFVVSLFSLSLAQPDFIAHWCNNTSQNHTKNSSQFVTNLDTLLTSLINQISSSNDSNIHHFSTLTIGSTVDRVNVIALCRADVAPTSECKSCISDAARKIRAVCPNQKEAIGWYVSCMLRYSSRPIFGTLATTPIFGNRSSIGVTDPTIFEEQVGKLFRRLVAKAATGDSRRKYAYGMAKKASDFDNAYAQVECTPDLSGVECSQCLKVLIDYANEPGQGNNNAMDGVVPSCYARYDIKQIYNSLKDESPIIISPPIIALTPATKSPVGKAKKSDNVSIIALPIAGAITIIMMIILSTLWMRKQRKSKLNLNSREDDGIDSTLETLQFKFGDIKVATKEFSNDNKLGQGGFGIVYKASLPNGQQVAAKRLLRKSGHGDLQFTNEIMILANLRHRNLVRLSGFCLEEEEKILIYELLPNGSLDKYIFDPVQRGLMLWETRYRIINGIARGLLYLHEESRLRIIHRDLKAANILLDAEFNPKIADFGMARLFNIDHTETMASKIVGTYGYMAPEYALHGHVSVKLDVFSFGVLVLEIVSGQRIGSFGNEESPEGLLTYAWNNWQEGTPWKIVDPVLSSNLNPQILECIHIGLLCVQHNLANRPTMSSVVLMLSNYSHTLPAPLPPGFHSQGNKKPKRPLLDHASDQSSHTLTECSTNEASITELCPR